MGVLDPHRKIGDSKPARAVQGALLVRAVGWAFLLRWSGARRVGDHVRLQALCFCVSNGCVVARVFGPEMFLFANKQQSLKSWTSTATAASEVRSFLSWAAVGCSGIQGSAVLVAGRQVQGCQGCQGNGQWVSTAHLALEVLCSCFVRTDVHGKYLCSKGGVQRSYSSAVKLQLQRCKVVARIKT